MKNKQKHNKNPKQTQKVKYLSGVFNLGPSDKGLPEFQTGTGTWTIQEQISNNKAPVGIATYTEQSRKIHFIQMNCKRKFSKS